MGDWGDKDGRKLTAYILLGVAGYILLANVGLLDAIGLRDVVRWLFRSLWNLLPSAILLLGVWWLVSSRSHRNPLIPWLMIGLGVLLLVSQFGLFGLSFGEMVVPAWLIVIAFFLINPRELLPRRFNTSTDELDDDEDVVNLIAFMGGGDLHYNSQTLRGGEIIAIMGGYEIDFTQADMEGDSMEINLICFMGGVEIRVPAHWEVEKQGAVCIMGGFSNKAQCHAEDLDLPRKRLIIKGVAFMGGGEFKN